MTDDQLNDLKQFIATTVRNEVSIQLSEQTKELKKALRRVEEKVDDLETATHTMIDTVGAEIENHDEKLTNHATRITKLEAAQLAA
ncbi:MAG: hypothetical protein WAW63_05535 [Candidatus Saccharimonadales bacterium]|nr:hypothetical protein [Candidatus Saccharibacteria bacterium]